MLGQIRRRLQSFHAWLIPITGTHDPSLLQSQILVALLRGLLVIAVLMTITGLWIDGEPNRLVLGAITVGGLLLLLRLCQVFPADLLVLAMIGLNYLVVVAMVYVLRHDPVLLITPVMYLALAVLVASLLLPLRWSFILGAAGGGLIVVLFHTVVPETSHVVFATLLRFYGLITMMILLIGLVRRRDRHLLIDQAQALRASALRWQSLVETIPDPVCICENQRIVDVNPAFEQAFGYSRAEMVGHALTDIVPPAWYDRLHPWGSQDIFLAELEMVSKDGRTLPVELRSYGQTLDRRSTRVTVIRDITIQKQAAQRLEDERNLLRTIIDNIPDHVYMKDTQSRFMVFNRTLRDHYQMDVTGKTDFDLPGKGTFADQLFAAEQHLLTTGEPLLNHELHLPAQYADDHQDHWLLETKVPLRDSSGQIIGLVGINRDITTQKRTQQALEAQRNLLDTIIDNLPDQVYVKDTEGRLLVTNRALKEFYAGQDIIGKTDQELIRFHEADWLREQEQQVMATGQPLVIEDPLPPLEPGGEPQGWKQIIKVPLRDRSGQVIGIVGINRDITVQKQAQQVLEAQRNLLDTIIDNLPDQVYVKDTEGRLLVTNRAVKLFYGDQELIGKTDYDLLPASSAEMFRQQEQQIIATGEPDILEAPVPPEVPAVEPGAWMQITKVPLRDRSGQVIGIVGINRNITPQKRAEMELRNERNLLRTVIDNLPDEIYVKDTEGRFLLISRALEKRFPDQNILGKTDHDLSPRYYADRFRQQEQTLLATGEVFIEEMPVPLDASPEHATSWTHMTKVPLRDSSGQIIGLVGINRDITAQKQAELVREAERNLLRTVIDSLPDQVYIKDTDGHFLMINRVLREMYGEHDIIGLTDFDLLPLSDAEMYRHEELNLIKTGQPVHYETFLKGILLPDRQDAWVQVSKVPLRDRSGQVIGLVGINRDITPQKRAETELRNERNLLRTVIENIPDHIYVKDRQHRFVLANRATGAWFGLSESLVGKTDYDLAPMMDQPDEHWLYEKHILETGEPMLNREFQGVDQDGKPTYMRITKVPLHDETGEIVGLVGINHMFTERRLTELALQEERNLLRTVIDNIPEHIYVKDRQHRFVLANAAVKKRWGRDIVGLTDADLLPPERLEWALASEREIFETGVPLLNLENSGVDVTGKPLWLLINKIPLRDAQGQIVGLVGVNNDITERKQAEMALAEERNLLRTLIDHLPDHIFVKDRQHRFVLVNRALQAIRPPHIIGKTDFDLVSPERARVYYEQEQHILETGEPLLDQPDQGTDKAGFWATLTSKLPLRDNAGRIVGLVGIVRDITEYEQAQARMRYLAALLENVSDAVISTDMDFRIVSWNRGAERLYGWREDEVLGKVLTDIVPTRFLQEIDATAATQALRSDKFWTGEVIHTDRSGQSLYIMNVTSLIHDTEGRPVGVVAVNRDVTERHLAEEQRVELAVERERVKILQQVISDMSHDLKHPLTNIRTSLYLLEKHIDQREKRKGYIDALDAQVTRLDSMLSDLLSMARLEQATEEFHFAPESMAELLAQVVSAQSMLADRRGQSLTFRNEAGQLVLEVDRSRLSRAVTNLVVNALNYTPEGGLVQVELRREKNQAVIDVRDNGIGIAPEQHRLIFERFYRVDKSRRSATGGTGLGLSIAQRIVEAHGGVITVDSAPGQGSVFSIRLPLNDSLSEHLKVVSP